MGIFDFLDGDDQFRFGRQRRTVIGVAADDRQAAGVVRPPLAAEVATGFGRRKDAARGIHGSGVGQPVENRTS